MSVDTRPTGQHRGERAATRPVRAERSGVRKGQLKKSQTIAPWVMLAPFLAVFLLTFVLPIIYAVFQSFTTVRREGLFGEQGVTTVFAGLENYALALTNDARAFDCITVANTQVLLDGVEIENPVFKVTKQGAGLTIKGTVKGGQPLTAIGAPGSSVAITIITPGGCAEGSVTVP